MRHQSDLGSIASGSEFAFGFGSSTLAKEIGSSPLRLFARKCDSIRAMQTHTLRPRLLFRPTSVKPHVKLSSTTMVAGTSGRKDRRDRSDRRDWREQRDERQQSRKIEMSTPRRCKVQIAVLVELLNLHTRSPVVGTFPCPFPFPFARSRRFTPCPLSSIRIRIAWRS